MLSSQFSAETDLSIYHSSPAFTPEMSPSNTLMLDRVKILVVDDESEERSLLKTLLELYGAHIITAESGLAALASFTDYRPQILISDISLTDFDGYELLKRIRNLEHSQDPLAASIPAIAISGFGGKERRQRALRAGFSEYIAKPCNPGELLAIMASITRQKLHAAM